MSTMTLCEKCNEPMGIEILVGKGLHCMHYCCAHPDDTRITIYSDPEEKAGGSQPYCACGRAIFTKYVTVEDDVASR